MSLDLYLYEKQMKECTHCWVTSEQTHSLYSATVTHDLNSMADEAGLYEILWRPEETHIDRAEQMIEPLEAGIALMKSDPPRFEMHNPKNGWGSYENFVPWLERLVEACREHPTALVRASR